MKGVVEKCEGEDKGRALHSFFKRSLGRGVEIAEHWLVGVLRWAKVMICIVFVTLMRYPIILLAGKGLAGFKIHSFLQNTLISDSRCSSCML